MKKNDLGVTLIALVITIIVLVILAGVAIAGIINSDGVIYKAQYGKQEMQEEDAKEKVILLLSKWKIRKVESKITLDEYLTSDTYKQEIESYGIYSVEKEEDENVLYYFTIKSGNAVYDVEVDEKANITNVYKGRVKIKIKDLLIKTESGQIPKEDSVRPTKKLVITFSPTISNGEITDVTCTGANTLTFSNGQVTYTTNGTEKEIKFTVNALTDGEVSSLDKTVNLEKLYWQTDKPHVIIEDGVLLNTNYKISNTTITQKSGYVEIKILKHKETYTGEGISWYIQNATGLSKFTIEYCTPECGIQYSTGYTAMFSGPTEVGNVHNNTGSQYLWKSLTSKWYKDFSNTYKTYTGTLNKSVDSCYCGIQSWNNDSITGTNMTFNVKSFYME